MIERPIKMSPFLADFFQATSRGFILYCQGYLHFFFSCRSVAGSYDNEGIAIFCMLFTYYLWIKARV
jgi:hypothetical protein